MKKEKKRKVKRRRTRRTTGSKEKRKKRGRRPTRKRNNPTTTRTEEEERERDRDEGGLFVCLFVCLFLFFILIFGFVGQARNRPACAGKKKPTKKTSSYVFLVVALVIAQVPAESKNIPGRSAESAENFFFPTADKISPLFFSPPHRLLPSIPGILQHHPNLQFLKKEKKTR